jgi:hypothetical protein
MRIFQTGLDAAKAALTTTFVSRTTLVKPLFSDASTIGCLAERP